MVFTNINTFLNGNQFVGIELFTIQNEENVAVLNVEKKKNELLLLNKESRGSINNLNNKINKTIPTIVVINNNNVIIKEIDSSETVETKILNKAFPNLKVDDFYYEIAHLNHKLVVAICRKIYVDELVVSYKSFGISITKISLGIISISTLLESFPQDTITTNTHLITTDSSDLIITPIEKQSVNIHNINGLEIPSSFLMSFCGVFNFVMGKNSKGSITELNAVLQNRFYQNSFFSKIGKMMIFVFLILLLINFFFFNYYFKKAEESSTSMIANKEIVTKIKLAKERLKIKEEKVKNFTLSSNSRSSEMINDLVKQIPTSILLTELLYHPLEKKIRPEDIISIQKDIILVSGITSNNEAFTNWIEQIEELKWLKNVTILNFGKNEEKETAFTIKISCQ